MADFSSSVNGMEKLNNFNYNNWSTRMRYYFLGQDLWDIVGDNNTTPPTNDSDLRKWNVESGKALYVLAVTVEDELLQHIKSAKTPSEAWDNLATLFARTNDAKLQCLENELLSVLQQSMTVSQYFSKVKSICEEISKLDHQNAISETRMRRIIIHRLRPEYNGIVTATRGWVNEPILTELENILANREALDKQIPKVTIKEDESALFSNKRGFKGQNRNRAGARDGKPWKIMEIGGGNQKRRVIS
ncbi:uncharacterized protein LOC108957181 [Eucalyptus grandis]|uniref:uncharacterized protein LOC108957181 n=1 Tax=Eucalyptus grandis TaxID=71139 RepID=UPI00192EADC4|nr:uncharacterized protein LOC108957181 [Eucalyptus grandis]